MAKTNQDQLRSMMRQWATGVSIVSTEHQGIQHGMTVNSFTSVSLDPQVVTISLTKSARTHDMIQKAGSFGITILSEEQQRISELFAKTASESEYRFQNLETLTLTTGAPLIKGGLAYLDCEVIAFHNFGTNSLIFGEVIKTKAGISGKPLIYYDQRYNKLQV